MTTGKLPPISVGDQVYLEDGGEEFGAVRDIGPGGRPEIIVYVENAGDFAVPLSAIAAVHSGKVVLRAAQLAPELRAAIAKAHDRETE
jgi:hypothetical protein